MLEYWKSILPTQILTLLILIYQPLRASAQFDIMHRVEWREFVMTMGKGLNNRENIHKKVAHVYTWFDAKLTTDFIPH